MLGEVKPVSNEKFVKGKKVIPIESKAALKLWASWALRCRAGSFILSHCSSVDTLASEIDHRVEVLPSAIGSNGKAAFGVCNILSVPRDGDLWRSTRVAKVAWKGDHGSGGSTTVCRKGPIGIASNTDGDSGGIFDKCPCKHGIFRIIVVANAASRRTTGAYCTFGVTARGLV